MATTTMAPQVERPVEKKIAPTHEPKPAGPEKSARKLSSEIFEGHEEFLGWTPD